MSKLLVSFDQLSYLIYSMLSTDLNSKETSINEITSRRLRSQIWISFFFYFSFQRQPRFNRIVWPFRKICDSQDGTDINDIGNLEDLLRIVFIHE